MRSCNEKNVLAGSVLCCAGGSDVEQECRCILKQGERGECKWIVGFLQVVSDKTVIMLKSTVLVAYPVYAGLLNSFTLYWWWLVENGLTLVGFLSTKRETCKVSDMSGGGKGQC